MGEFINSQCELPFGMALLEYFIAEVMDPGGNRASANDWQRISRSEESGIEVSEMKF
jgi:hypothetical protein